MVGSISQHAGSLHNNLFAPQKEQAVAVSLIAPGLAGTENVSLSAKAVDASRNMLASNFASAGHGEFRYLSAMKNGFAAEQNMILSMKRNEVIAVFEAIVEMGSWHGNKSMQHAKLMKDLTESDEKNLKAIREYIKEKAQESQQVAEQNATSEKTKTGAEHAGVKQREIVSAPEEGMSVSALDTAAPEQERPLRHWKFRAQNLLSSSLRLILSCKTGKLNFLVYSRPDFFEFYGLSILEGDST